MLCLIHWFLLPGVVNCTVSEQKCKNALYVWYKICLWNYSFMFLAATLLTLILETQPYNSQRLPHWGFYICFTTSIYRLVELWSHCLENHNPMVYRTFRFYYIMNTRVFMINCCFKLTILLRVNNKFSSDFTFLICPIHKSPCLFRDLFLIG